MENSNVTKITIKYTGSEVDDGTMPVENLLSALQGFSNAYSKVVKHKGIAEPHQLRLVGLEKGSCDIVINVLEIAQQVNDVADQLIPTIGISGGIVISVFKVIVSLIKMTKHTQNKSYEVKVNGNNNNVVIQNLNNVSLEVPMDIYEIYKSKLIATDLNKIVEPLDKGNIDSTKLLANEDGTNLIEENITSDEKEYFAVQNVDVTTTKETWLDGTINSLTKSTNNGRFILNNGDNVPFHFCMDNPKDFYHYFSSKGFVKIKCIAHLDEFLKPIRLDVYDITESQIDLFDKR